MHPCGRNRAKNQMMKPRLFFLCFLFSFSLYAQNYTIAVKLDSLGQIYLKTDSCSLQPTEYVGHTKTGMVWNGL